MLSQLSPATLHSVQTTMRLVCTCGPLSSFLTEETPACALTDQWSLSGLGSQVLPCAPVRAPVGKRGNELTGRDIMGPLSVHSVSLCQRPAASPTTATENAPGLGGAVG
jgi:hypothetical protein